MSLVSFARTLSLQTTPHGILANRYRFDTHILRVRQYQCSYRNALEPLLGTRSGVSKRCDWVHRKHRPATMLECQSAEVRARGTLRVDSNEFVAHLAIGRQRCVDSFGHKNPKTLWINSAATKLLKAKRNHPLGSQHQRQSTVRLANRGSPLIEIGHAAVTRFRFAKFTLVDRKHSDSRLDWIAMPTVCLSTGSNAKLCSDPRSATVCDRLRIIQATKRPPDSQ